MSQDTQQTRRTLKERAFAAGYAQGIAEERAINEKSVADERERIAAWLTKMCIEAKDSAYEDAGYIATAIRNGEHNTIDGRRVAEDLAFHFGSSTEVELDALNTSKGEGGE
jgi:hypothetical protein